MISSQIDDCQVTLERQRTDNQEFEARVNSALKDKELKESQIGVVQMAVEQLFRRAVASCLLPQRIKQMHDAVDVKFAPARGDYRSDLQLEAMLDQIIERMSELKEINQSAREALKMGRA